MYRAPTCDDAPLQACARADGSEGGSGEFGEVDVAHVAGVGKLGVECECRLKGVGSLTALAELEVVAEEGTVVGVGAVLDDDLGTLQGILAAKVGDALVGDEDVDGVLGVVGVTDHGHDVGDESALGDRGA